MKIKLYSFLLLFLLTYTGTVSAASLSLSYTGTPGVYRIDGTGMETVGGMSFIVVYDSKALSDPQVTRGPLISNAFFDSNSIPSNSLINFAVTSFQNLNSSGTIATIKFNVKVSTPPKPEIKNIDLIANDKYLSKIEANVTEGTDATGGSGNIGEGNKTVDSSTTTETANTGGNDTSGNTTTASTGQGGWLGTVTFPSSDTSSAGQKEPVKQPESTVTPQEQQPSEPVASRTETPQATSPQEEKREEPKAQLISHISMIDRFSKYEGERTPAKLLALLKETGKGYVQEPPALLSDGKATLKVYITLPPDTTTAPNVAISREGQMVSFLKGETGNWVVEVRPKKDVSQVTLTYFVNDQVTEIPLTVAPKLESFRGKPFAKLTEADFAQFIAGRTAGKEIQPFDLNRDKLLNHVDDFIFAVNYMLQAPPLKPDKRPATEKPSQEPATTKPQQEKAKPSTGSPGKN